MARGRHLRGALARQGRGNFSDQGGRDQRLVTLDVDDDPMGGIAPTGDDFRNTIRAGRVALARDDGVESMLRNHLRDSRVVRGNDDLVRAARTRTFGNPYHHWFPAKVREWLARKTGGGVASGDDDDELQMRNEK